jgi:hypothetical protein
MIAKGEIILGSGQAQRHRPQEQPTGIASPRSGPNDQKRFQQFSIMSM